MNRFVIRSVVQAASKMSPLTRTVSTTPNPAYAISKSDGHELERVGREAFGGEPSNVELAWVESAKHVVVLHHHYAK